MAGYFELKRAKCGLFHFNFHAGNGQVLLNSEMYEAKASAMNGINSLIKNAQIDERYEKLVSKSHKPYFVIKAGNHQVISQSQQYESEAGRDHSIDAVKRNIIDARIIDLTA